MPKLTNNGIHIRIITLTILLRVIDHYDVLFHTDLTRTSGQSNGLDLDRLNWET